MEGLMKIPQPIKVKQEDPSDVIDLDAVKTPEDIVYEWDYTVRKQLNKHISPYSELIVYGLMEWYMKELQGEVSEFEDQGTLKTSMMKHIKFFETAYRRLKSFSDDKYLDLMEEIVTRYCNTVIDYVTHKKKNSSRKEMKKIIGVECRKIKCILNQCLLGQHHRILHVLIKINIDPESQPCRDLLNHIFGHFITRLKQNKSDINFCRGYIIFQKWKVLRKSDERHTMDECMYNIYSKSPDCIETNPMMRTILLPPTNSTCIGLGGKVMANIKDMAKEYFKYIKSKEKRDDECPEINIGELDNKKFVDWDDGEEDEEFDKMYRELEDELQRAASDEVVNVKDEDVATSNCTPGKKDEELMLKSGQDAATVAKNKGKSKDQYEEEDCVIVAIGRKGANLHNTVLLTEILEDEHIAQISYHVKKDNVEHITQPPPKSKPTSFLDSIILDDEDKPKKLRDKTKKPTATVPKIIQVIDVDEPLEKITDEETDTPRLTVRNVVDSHTSTMDLIEKPRPAETLTNSCSISIETQTEMLHTTEELPPEKATSNDDENVYPGCSYFILTPPSEKQTDDHNVRAPQENCLYASIIRPNSDKSDELFSNLKSRSVETNSEFVEEQNEEIRGKYFDDIDDKSKDSYSYSDEMQPMSVDNNIQEEEDQNSTDHDNVATTTPLEQLFYSNFPLFNSEMQPDASKSNNSSTCSTRASSPVSSCNSCSSSSSVVNNDASAITYMSAPLSNNTPLSPNTVITSAIQPTSISLPISNTSSNNSYLSPPDTPVCNIVSKVPTPLCSPITISALVPDTPVCNSISKVVTTLSSPVTTISALVPDTPVCNSISKVVTPLSSPITTISALLPDFLLCPTSVYTSTSSYCPSNLDSLNSSPSGTSTETIGCYSPLSSSAVDEFREEIVINELPLSSEEIVVGEDENCERIIAASVENHAVAEDQAGQDNCEKTADVALEDRKDEDAQKDQNVEEVEEQLQEENMTNQVTKECESICAMEQINTVDDSVVTEITKEDDRVNETLVAQVTKTSESMNEAVIQKETNLDEKPNQCLAVADETLIKATVVESTGVDERPKEDVAMNVIVEEEIAYKSTDVRLDTPQESAKADGPANKLKVIPEKVLCSDFLEKKIMFTSQKKTIPAFEDDVDDANANWDEINNTHELGEVLSGPVTKIQGTIVNPDENFDLFEPAENPTEKIVNKNSELKKQNASSRGSPEDLISPAFEPIDDFKSFYQDKVPEKRKEDSISRKSKRGVRRRSSTSRESNLQESVPSTSMTTDLRVAEPSTSGELKLKIRRIDNSEPKRKRLVFSDNIQTSDDPRREVPKNSNNNALQGILKRPRTPHNHVPKPILIRIPRSRINMDSLDFYHVPFTDKMLQGNPRVFVERLKDRELLKWVKVSKLLRHRTSKVPPKKPPQKILRVDYDKTTSHINENDVVRFSTPSGSQTMSFFQSIGRWKNSSSSLQGTLPSTSTDISPLYDNSSCDSLAVVFQNLNVTAIEEAVPAAEAVLNLSLISPSNFDPECQSPSASPILEVCSPVNENPNIENLASDAEISEVTFENPCSIFEPAQNFEISVVDRESDGVTPESRLSLAVYDTGYAHSVPDYQHPPDPSFEQSLPFPQDPDVFPKPEEEPSEAGQTDYHTNTCLTEINNDQVVNTNQNLKRPYSSIQNNELKYYDSCKSLLENFDEFNQEPAAIPTLKTETTEHNGRETKLPLKKRKMSVSLEKTQEQYIEEILKEASKKDIEEILKEAKKEICYPATPMLSIADVQEQEKLPRPFKTAAERKEIPPIDYNLLTGQPRIVTEQYNNHTYNNPTINYHMNSPFPQPFSFNYACAPVAYFSLLPLNSTTTFTSNVVPPASQSAQQTTAHQQPLLLQQDYVPAATATQQNIPGHIVTPNANQTTLLLQQPAMQDGQVSAHHRVDEQQLFLQQQQMLLQNHQSQKVLKQDVENRPPKRGRGRPRKQKLN